MSVETPRVFEVFHQVCLVGGVKNGKDVVDRTAVRHLFEAGAVLYRPTTRGSLQQAVAGRYFISSR